MRAITWAVNVKVAATGREAFLRARPDLGAVLGRGPIATFSSKARAEHAAARVRRILPAGDEVTVFERSHGRQFS